MYRPEEVTQVGDDDADDFGDDHDNLNYRTDFYSDLSNVSPTDFTSEGSPADSKYASDFLLLSYFRHHNAEHA